MGCFFWSFFLWVREDFKERRKKKLFKSLQKKWGVFFGVFFYGSGGILRRGEKKNSSGV